MLQDPALVLYRNDRQGSTSLSVTPPPTPPPPPQNSLTSLWFLAVIAAIVAGALIGFTFLKRKKKLPPHLQVDLKDVVVETAEVRRQYFFMTLKDEMVEHE